MHHKVGLLAKKSMGQHFLTNRDIASKIVDAPDYGLADNRVLEIGPGPGILTGLLLEKQLNLICAELDFDMINLLQKKYPELEGRLIQGDVLRMNFENVFDNMSFTIIGNFPYNISSQIVFQMLHNRHLIPQMTGMFQKEMAERIIAPPGSKTYGIISVLTQAWYEGERVVTVPPGAFDPPPKVNSLVIKLTRKPDTQHISDYKSFTQVVKQSFAMRRKMLRNNLKPLFTNHSLLVDKFFDQRPEQLSLQQFIDLTDLYISQKP